MKRLILYIIALIIIGLIIYRFVERRSVEAVKTIAMIQAEEGYPVEVDEVVIGSFSLIRKYTGTVIGGKEATVVSSLAEHISRVLVSEGQYVEENQVICELSRDNPAASYAQAKLALANIEKELARMEKLFEEGALSEQILDGLKLQRDLAKENLSSIERLLYIRVPIAGRITELQAEPGMLATPGFTLAKVVSAEKLRVQVKIPASDRDLVKIGANCNISTDGASLSGKVQRVSFSADPDDRNFSAWINFTEKSSGYRFSPGLLVDVHVNVLDVSHASLVSPDALVREGDKWSVYTVDGNRARLNEVDVGGQTADAAWIRSGIDPGAKVVVSGAGLLVDGAPIRVIKRLVE